MATNNGVQCPGCGRWSWNCDDDCPRVRGVPMVGRLPVSPGTVDDPLLVSPAEYVRLLQQIDEDREPTEALIALFADEERQVQALSDMVPQ